jgi:diguanylate cyclase (GGDEF)-like protein
MFKRVSPQLKNWLPASIAIVVSLCIAVFVWNQRQQRLLIDLQADFSFESREVAVRLLERMRAHKQILRGVRAAISTMGVPDREGWARFVNHHFLPVDFPGMQGLGYATRIELAGLKAHLARMKAAGYPGYLVLAGSKTSGVSAPISRLAPELQINSVLIGLDLMGQPGLDKLLTSSAAQSSTLLSAPVRLALPQLAIQQQLSFLVQPIFSSPLGDASGHQASDAANRATRDGWVFAVFKAPDLIKATLGALPANMRLRVFDDKSQAATTVIFDSAAGKQLNWGVDQPLSFTTELDLDGQVWTLVFEGFPRAYARNLSFNWEFFSILAICALFGLSTILITLTRSASRRLLSLTNELQDSNARYQFLATHDALTKLANRVLFQSRLETTLSEAIRYERHFALIYIDLDKFKPVNDVHGHEVGDLLLKAVAQRLAVLLRDSDLLARRGGDEFVVLLPSVDDVEGVDHVAQKICLELARPFELARLSIQIGGSLGISFYPEDGNTVEQLIIQADQRMYQAKQLGGNSWVSSGKQSHEK